MEAGAFGAAARHDARRMFAKLAGTDAWGALPVLDDQALTARDGARLPVHKWLSDAVDPKAVIVAIHGFAQYGGVFRYPAPALAARGISVYAMDLRGNGAAPEMGV